MLDCTRLESGKITKTALCSILIGLILHRLFGNTVHICITYTFLIRTYQEDKTANNNNASAEKN